MMLQLKGIEWFSIRFAAILALAIVVFGVAVRSKVADVDGAPYVIAVYTVVAVGGILFGGLLGFIFAVPRFLRQDGDGRAQAAASGAAAPNERQRAPRTFAGNTNLEEISDWLTKIIVGLGLTQAGKIWGYGADLTTRFSSQAMSGVPGGGPFFVIVASSALIGGFLFFYLETRTRITLLLTDADSAAGPQGASAAAVDASMNAPLASDSRYGAEVAPDLTDAQAKADHELLALPFEALRSAAEFAAWAAAQARSGNWQTASKAIGEAMARDPGNQQYLAMLADIRFRLGNARGAVDAYAELLTKRPDDPAILRRELLATLYLPPPESFNRALATADRLLKADPTAQTDAWVQVWLAAARGQQYTWLVQNKGTEEDKRTVRAAALDASRAAARLMPDAKDPARQLLARLLDPARGGADNQDNDLYAFSADTEFRSAILGETGQTPPILTPILDERPPGGRAPVPEPQDPGSRPPEEDGPRRRLPDEP